ncbi:MAG: tetratricopeptide repeat protein [Marinobacter sp.]|uniref:tetratricopeptide repeat protein n=1 Tax=Marinobacter sp. TaxID=50741 RepID=UPI003F994975
MLKKIPLLIVLTTFCMQGYAQPVDLAGVQSLNDEALEFHGAGNYEHAAERYQTLLPLLQAHFGESSEEEARILASLADTQLAREKYEEAELTYRKTMDILANQDLPILKADALNGLASSLYLRRRFAKAEPLFVEANEMLEATPSAPIERRLLVLDNLAALYQSLGRTRQAEKYQAQARALRQENH